MRKSVYALLAFLLIAGCHMAPQKTGPGTLTPGLGGLQGDDAPAQVAMLLPLSGKTEKLGQAFRNAGTLAQFEMAGNNFELSFYDTKGTPDGAVEAYYDALKKSPDAILGPIMSQEVKAIQAENPKIPVLSFTSDETVVGKNVYTTALLISEQVKKIVDFACQAGRRKLALLGPDDTMGTLTVEAAERAALMCPGMVITQQVFYPADTVNFSPFVLKMIPAPVDPKKKNLTEAERIRLETPIQDQLDFDALLIFERGTKLQQLASLLSYYDVTPEVIPILGLASFGDVSDKALNGAYFVGLPSQDYTNFEEKYRGTFGVAPLRLSSLAYDAVSLVAVLTQQHNLTRRALTDETGYRGTDGLFRLNEDGTNTRALEVFQIVSPGHFRTVQASSTTFAEPPRPAVMFDREEPQIPAEEVSEMDLDAIDRLESIYLRDIPQEPLD